MHWSHAGLSGAGDGDGVGVGGGGHWDPEVKHSPWHAAAQSPDVSMHRGGYEQKNLVDPLLKQSLHPFGHAASCTRHSPEHSSVHCSLEEKHLAVARQNAAGCGCDALKFLVQSQPLEGRGVEA